MAPYHVAVAQFEGPLDLLVQLVEANQLEVTAISAAAVTEQFLQTVGQLSDGQLSEISRYLELATRLLLIKSAALLPGTDKDSEPELIRLAEELEEYQRNRSHAGRLSTCLAASGRSYGRPARPAAVRPAVIPEAASLLTIYQQLLDAKPAWESSAAPKLTLAEMQGRIEQRLNEEPQPLHDMILAEDGPGEVALLLVAVLELVKHRRAAVHQPEPFGRILVSQYA